MLAKDQDILKYQMVNDHREQELRRLEAIIEAMAIINPRQVQHLRDMQMEFKFKRREFDYHTSLSTSNALSTGSLDDEEDDVSSTGTGSGVENLLNKSSSNDSIGKNESLGISYNQKRTKSLLGDMRQHRVEFMDGVPYSAVQDAQFELLNKLSEADRSLLLRAKWLIHLYTSKIDSDMKFSSRWDAADEDSRSKDSRSIRDDESETSSVLASQTEGGNYAVELEQVGTLLISILAFLERGDTHCFSTNDLKEWTQHIMTTMRTTNNSTTDVTDNNNTGKETERNTATSSKSKEIDGSWRDVLVNLRYMYPVAQGDRLEVGLSTRITEMRSRIADVTRAKTAKQLPRGKRVEGLVLEAEEADEPPNVYAANISNMVREVNRRMSLEDSEMKDKMGGEYVVGEGDETSASTA
eukprot:CAMPEP_0182425886 /NCGR_PEP_ID=MMETSP1167-20130531/12375_1 /TAXON_ID=2988 /ORGANISM="Mallomonas Sp, Strain CCMP3275" /LENGTH=410 /DNA_ID=CAMNT_0024606953 /DNA_START=807 /DNA_END=2039 /DNA_ORIENTATION=-